MSNCAGPIGECVSALQEILDNLIKIQDDITGPYNNNNTKLNNKNNSADCETKKLPINGTPEDGADCKAIEDCSDIPWYCLPPAVSKNEDEECSSPDESSQLEDDECDENEIDEETCDNIDVEADGDDSCDKVDNQKNTDGFQRIIAVRENCDGSVSKIYALRKNIRPPTTGNRKTGGKCNDTPNAESTRTSDTSRLCPEDNDKTSPNLTRKKIALRENTINCDSSLNRTTKSSPTKNSANSKSSNSPQTFNSSVNDGTCVKNPFVELQSIIEKERKRIDSICQGGDKLLSSIEKNRRNYTDRIIEKGNKTAQNTEASETNCQSSQSAYPTRQLQTTTVKPKKTSCRIQTLLSEEETKKLLEQMIETTITGVDKIAKLLISHSQEIFLNPNKGSSNLTCTEIDKLRKQNEVAEHKIACLRKSVNDLLVNMSCILSCKANIPEIHEMVKELQAQVAYSTQPKIE